MSNAPQSAVVAAAPSRRQIAIVALVIIAYAGLSHYANATPDARGLGAALSLGPVLLIALALAWRWLPKPVAALTTLAAITALVTWWPQIRRNYEWADLAQQCGIFMLIGAGFARTLFGGRVPACTAIAQRLHGELGAVELTYLRRATLAWALFYALLGAAILALYFLVSLSAWSMFVNFGTFALIALLAFADHALRQRLLPRRAGGGLLTALRVALIG